MCSARAGSIIVCMTKAARAIAFLVIVVVVLVWDPLGALAGGLDLPSIAFPDLPDLPGWLAFMLGPGKLIALVAVVVLVALARSGLRRGGSER